MSASTYTLIPGFKNGAPVGAISVWAKAFMTGNQLSIIVGPRNARHRKFGQFRSYTTSLLEPGNSPMLKSWRWREETLRCRRSTWSTTWSTWWWMQLWSGWSCLMNEREDLVDRPETLSSEVRSELWGRRLGVQLNNGWRSKSPHGVNLVSYLSDIVSCLSVRRERRIRDTITPPKLCEIRASSSPQIAYIRNSV